MGTEVVAMSDRDTVREKNARDLKRAWREFLKMQEAHRENKAAAPVAKNKGVRAEV